MMGVPLVQPIRGGVGRDGRLVFADDALRRLHMRAGGTDGGHVAIPGLAALAALTHQLKMRLSRSVTVADVDEDIELWVEASIDADLAKLSILSWRALPSKRSRDEAEFDDGALRSELQFDARLRLIGAKGFVAAQLHPSDFGGSLGAVMTKIINDAQKVTELTDLITARRTFTIGSVRSTAFSAISVSGAPQFSDNQSFAGYVCGISVADEQPIVAAPMQSPEILFGRQLAPILRQPLGRIIANAETIGSALNGPIRENYALYGRDIASAARHLLALVDDLGDLEAVERADFVTAKDDIELGDVARRVAGLLALKAADHRIRIVTPTDAQTVPAVAEFRRVL